jgi:DNA-binding transcriptional ArsR family regulator
MVTLTPAKEKELERVLKALANRRRVAIVRYLKARTEASVGDIAEEIRLSFKSTSRHLSVLMGAGIFDREQRGLNMFYRIAPDLPSVASRIITIL